MRFTQENERVSKYTLLHKLTAAKITRPLIGALRPHRNRVHTITADNGKAFAGHRKDAVRLGAGFYFATPYHAGERSLNGNTNGLVRQYCPNGTNPFNVSARDVRRVQNLLNARPRKTLAYKSPNEVFFDNQPLPAGLKPLCVSGSNPRKKNQEHLRFGSDAYAKWKKVFASFFKKKRFLPYLPVKIRSTNSFTEGMKLFE